MRAEKDKTNINEVDRSSPILFAAPTVTVAYGLSGPVYVYCSVKLLGAPFESAWTWTTASTQTPVPSFSLNVQFSV